MKKLIHSFTARKILELLLTLLIVTFLSFLLVKLSPVDAAEAYARRTFMLYTPEQLDELREEMGLNQPLLVQYGTWVGNALHLDFGTSLVNGRSVLGEVSRAMGVTLSIVLIAAVIEAVGILLVGSLCYWCRRKWAHLLLVFVCIVGVSIPPFFLASSFLDVFAVRFGWISVASSTGLMRYLPAAICLAVGGIALYSQLLSKNIEREMNEDYAVYARCRGLSDMRILWTHALPHALAGLAPSFLQMVGISLAGSAIVEKIFSLPGLGYSIVDSVLYRDTPMIHATILFLAFFLVICNAVSDILQRIFQRGHAEGGGPMKKLHILFLSILPALVILFCFLGFLAAPNDPEEVVITQSFLAPCAEYPLGTDQYGRCVLSRILYGGYTTLGIVLMGSAIVMTVGITAVKQTDDPAEVQELYNYLINYDLCNVIDIPLTYYKDLILYNTDKIAGYEFSGVPAFFDVSGLQPVA